MDLIERVWPVEGFSLMAADGSEHNRIRGDQIPHDTIVIINDGHSFVHTGERTDFNFAIYREGFKTFTYQSSGA
jgi:hypothetical protein